MDFQKIWRISVLSRKWEILAKEIVGVCIPFQSVEVMPVVMLVLQHMFSATMGISILLLKREYCMQLPLGRSIVHQALLI